MFEEADNFADIFRGGLPYCLLIALPILIICSSSASASELTVHRMSQFDVNGVAYGCRASALSLEARSLYTWSTARHCVVAKLEDIGINEFLEIRQKAGALFIMLPQDVKSMNTLKKHQLIMLEQTMLAQTISIPVYFSSYNTELDTIISDITRATTSKNANHQTASSAQRSSAISEIFSTISANGYQITVTGASHAASKINKIPIIQGELTPSHYIIKQAETVEHSNLPIIILTANLKTFGLYNNYPSNTDVAVLMSLVEVFSKLSNIPSATPKYRLIFLLTESGMLLNFQGVKKWLDENVVLQNIDFVLCLDTLINVLDEGGSNSLYMHVSKPPKEGTTTSAFFKILKSVATKQFNNITIEGVHKKINLAEQQLAWEHERFSMKRFPAFTLSSVKNPKHQARATIFKDNEMRLVTQTLKHTQLVAEALALYMYKIDLSDVTIFDGAIQINKNIIRSYMNVKSALNNNDIKDGFEKYLKNVKIIYDKPDIRDPDFMLYDGQEAKANIYRVKPAVFDLFLTIIICVYLTSVYYFVQHFPQIYDIVCKLSKTQKVQHINGNYSQKSKTN